MKKVLVDKIISLQNKIDNIAQELMKDKKFAEAYKDVVEGEGEYSVVSCLYAASASLEQILEREIKK